jgi:hypothetical protein
MAEDHEGVEPDHPTAPPTGDPPEATRCQYQARGHVPELPVIND